jgi:enamine deaminase RidA (YjgF/YER057c/UK114 family)
MYTTKNFEKSEVKIFTFDKGSTSEHHLAIRIKNTSLPFQQQLDSILDTYMAIISTELQGSTAVLKRYFMSDAANQADLVMGADSCDCAKSVIQQPPLDGTKIALWAYLLTNVTTRIADSGLYEVTTATATESDGTIRHLWNASAHNLAANSEFQTRLLFNEYIMQLAQEGCTLAGNCIRTWLFVNDIDLNYGGVVRARNQVFFTQGLTHDTHFIASTGIGGKAQDPCVLTQMDNYAVAGIRPEQIRHLYAPSHLNRTSDYGVSFERGTMVDYGDRRHVFISGTASIGNKGQILFPGDVRQQTLRVWENVEALLNEADCTFDDVAQMTVYLRDTADYFVVSRLFAERFGDKPLVIVLAPVCRPGWLVEMECIAVKDTTDERFPAF